MPELAPPMRWTQREAVIEQRHPDESVGSAPARNGAGYATYAHSRLLDWAAVILSGAKDPQRPDREPTTGRMKILRLTAQDDNVLI